MPRNAFEQEILDAHNKARAKEDRGLSDLKWSAQLQADAQWWAEECSFTRSAPAGQGQNLYMELAPTASASSAVSEWMREQSNYIDKQAPTEGCLPGKVCKHYTQIVWHNTTEVGCAMNRCSGILTLDDRSGKPGTLLVCNYSPAGNIPGQSAFPPK